MKRLIGISCAVAALAAVAADEPTFMNILPTAIGHEEQTAADAKEYVRRTGNKIVLYSLSFHPEGFPAKEKADRLVASYRKLHQLLKGSDVQLGVLIQSVIGHWPRVDEKIEPWTRTITLKGDVSRFCPLDPNFRAYIKDFVKGLAAEHPSFVMGDDDIHLYDECFCDLHRAEFNRRTGRSCTAEEFRKVVGAAKPGSKDYEAFFKLQRETVTGVCSLIREAIDEVDPKVPAGMCMSWVEYRFIGDLAKAIAAKGQSPLLRIANDAGYAEFDRDTFADLVLRTAAYEAVYGRDCTLLDESDVFPHNLWNKSAANLRAKLAFSLVQGIDGGLLWFTCGHRWGFSISDSYAQAIEQNMPRFRALKRFAGESKALGFTVPVQRNFPDWRFNGEGLDAFVSGLNWGGSVAAVFGVPFRCSTTLDDGGVYAIAGERTVERFSDMELKTLLAGRLLLDGDAVRAMVKRGFARHLGLTIENRKLNYVCERSTDGKRTYPFRLVAAHPAPTLAPAKGAEALTWLEFESYAGAPDHKRLAPATVYYENELGGKVLSAAYTLETGSAWSLQRFFRYCEPRKAWFARVLDRLQPQPFVVEEMRDMVALARERADGVKLLFVINTNRDPLEKLNVRVKFAFKTVELLGADGAYKEVKFVRNGDTLTFDTPLACYEFTALRFR